MKIRSKVLTVGLALTGIACSLCFGNTYFSSRGIWPHSWPKEIEAFRARSRTIGEDWATIHQIPFDTPEEFQKAWPHILGLKSKGAPIILEDGPSTYYSFSNTTLRAGVRILCPLPPWPVHFANGTSLQLGPPWPDSAISAAGELPEYVMEQGGTWVPFDGRKDVGHWRARVEIILVIDHQAVDTNHIQIPDTETLIDRRGKK